MVWPCISGLERQRLKSQPNWSVPSQWRPQKSPKVDAVLGNDTWSWHQVSTYIDIIGHPHSYTYPKIWAHTDGCTSRKPKVPYSTMHPGNYVPKSRSLCKGRMCGHSENLLYSSLSVCPGLKEKGAVRVRRYDDDKGLSCYNSLKISPLKWLYSISGPLDIICRICC